MKKTRVVEIVEVFCDVCGDKCGNHAVHSDAKGHDLHACLEYNEQLGKQCATVLEERLLAVAIASRKPA
ncbi:hypothetical protein [Pseudomonas lini]|uniref:hypothetical protein n=1 Tax=Pseudomonas lini TaxID=163011 RepID=UPI0006827E48|nr:hypothetical protein [Pseudomonas lini]KNH43916.1 hypothetical protein ACS73_23555 [Pseudomonas lini]